MPKGPIAPEPSDLDAVQRLAATRSSCRAYLPDPVPHAVIETVLGIAARSPSWCNVQPWHLTVIGGEARRDLGERLLAAHDNGGTRRPDVAFPGDYAGSYGERRRESGLALYQALGITRDDKARRAQEMRRNFDFFGAPHVLLISAPAELGAYGMLDCGLLVGAFLLAAEAAGLGAIAQASVALHAELLRDVLHLPPSRKILCAVAFGYPQRDHRVNGWRTSRAELSQVATFIDTLPSPIATQA